MRFPYFLHMIVVVLSFLLVFEFLLSLETLHADVPATLGGGNYNFHNGPEPMKLLKHLGLGMTRIPVDMENYWNGTVPTPEKIDQQVLIAHQYGVTPILLFEYYTRFKVDLGGSDKWKAIGQAYAGRFAPNSAWLRSQGIQNWGVTYYTAINEPEWKENNPVDINIDQYASALEGLADGIHTVDPKLIAAPGGFQETPLMGDDPYARRLAPIFNSGKLGAFDIHRYWDVQYIPMSQGATFSLQHQFDDVKKRYGITADIKFYTTEMNFKKRLVTEDEAAAGFLTAIWDGLTVVGNDGQRVSRFVLMWNIFNTTEEDSNFGLAAQKYPWAPDARGKVLLMVAKLTRGMEFVSVDPRLTGISILEGNGNKLWVWQNRQGWSSLAGTSLNLQEIPPSAISIDIYGWNGPIKHLPLKANTSSLTIDQLPTNQTLMFIASQNK